MRSIVIKIIFTTLLSILWLTQAAAAGCDAEQRSGNNSPTIIFINGILNDYDSACQSLTRLKATLTSNGVDLNPYDGVGLELLWNSSDGYAQDINELRIQGALSSLAATRNSAGTVSGYYKKLGEIYQNLTDKSINCASIIQYDKSSAIWKRMSASKSMRMEISPNNLCDRILATTGWLRFKMSFARGGSEIVVVAHSQGNFYLEAAYSLLLYNNHSSTPYIRGVGVAAISKYPVSSKYITLSQDNAISFLQTLNTSVIANLQYAPAPSTHTACISGNPCDLDHGENPHSLAAITGSTSLNNLPPEVIQALAEVVPSDKQVLMHEFLEVYLNQNLTDDSVNKLKLPTHVSGMVADSLRELVSQRNCGDITSPQIVGQQGPLYSAVVGQSTTFTATAKAKPKYPFEYYQWQTSDGGEGGGPTPDFSRKFVQPGQFTVTVTPILADGTTCTLSSATSKISVSLPAPIDWSQYYMSWGFFIWNRNFNIADGLLSLSGIVPSASGNFYLIRVKLPGTYKLSDLEYEYGAKQVSGSTIMHFGFLHSYSIFGYDGIYVLNSITANSSGVDVWWGKIQGDGKFVCKKNNIPAACFASDIGSNAPQNANSTVEALIFMQQDPKGIDYIKVWNKGELIYYVNF